MAEIAHRKVEEIDAIRGALPGIQMHRVGGQIVAQRPQQLNQEEVYIALRGSGTLIADGEEYPLDPDHIAKVPPEIKREVIAGDQGLRLLSLGGTAGQAYLTGGTL